MDVDQSRNDLCDGLAILQIAVTQWEDGVTTLVLAACKTLGLQVTLPNLPLLPGRGNYQNTNTTWEFIRLLL